MVNAEVLFQSASLREYVVTEGTIEEVLGRIDMILGRIEMILGRIEKGGKERVEVSDEVRQTSHIVAVHGFACLRLWDKSTECTFKRVL